MAVCKEPATDMEALKSSLMGLMEKKRVVAFYKYIQKIDPQDPNTWDDVDLANQPMEDVFKKFNLEENTIDFLGHAVAMHYSDTYLVEPALPTLEKMKLYQ